MVQLQIVQSARNKRKCVGGCLMKVQIMSERGILASLHIYIVLTYVCVAVCACVCVYNCVRERVDVAVEGGCVVCGLPSSDCPICQPYYAPASLAFNSIIIVLILSVIQQW